MSIPPNPGVAVADAPQHGYRGEQPPADLPTRSKGLTVAISREAGARGGSVARRVGQALGWQVYNQELLDYLCQNETARDQLLADVPDEARRWADHHYTRLENAGRLPDDADTALMLRLVLALAARGEAVLVGRGAGYLLPPESTLHVRIVAPETDRVAYMSQWLRLPREEAADEVRRRDAKRAEYLARHFHKNPNDLNVYDLVLNSGRLGEEMCAELIGLAVRGKEYSDAGDPFLPGTGSGLWAAQGQ